MLSIYTAGGCGTLKGNADHKATCPAAYSCCAAFCLMTSVFGAGQEGGAASLRLDGLHSTGLDLHPPQQLNAALAAVVCSEQHAAPDRIAC